MTNTIITNAEIISNTVINFATGTTGVISQYPTVVNVTILK